MGFFGMVGIVVFAFSFIFHMAARKEVESDYQAGRSSAPRMLKMKRMTGQAMGVAGALMLASFAVSDDEPVAQEEVAATETEEAEQAEDIDYMEVARNAADVRDLEAALKEIDRSVESVRLHGNLAIVRYDGDETVWSENTMVKEFATDSTRILSIIQSNPNYGDVAFERFGTLIDDKGNERKSGFIKALYFESDIDALNFDNFRDMVTVDASKFYNNATGYAIYGAIYMNIEDDLRYSMSWAKDPETELYDVYF